jgi:hypothetical protein
MLHALRKERSFRRCIAGDAWPSSVRGLNCSLKWVNERNPRRVLYVSHETAWPFAQKRKVCDQWAGRKERMTPGQHVP